MKTILYILLSAVLLSACDLVGNIDKIKPEYNAEEEDIIQDTKTAEQALRGVYEQWRIWGISTFRTHMSFYSGSLRQTGAINGATGFTENNVQADNIAITDLYTGYYTVINAANYVIQMLENGQARGLDSLRRVEMISECKIHRALAHFSLLRLFGQFWDSQSVYGIVLRTEPYKTLTVSPRQSVDSCYRVILKDLDDAITGAPEMVETHDYMSRTTAKALKAKVLLYTKDYVNAAKYAAEVIDEAPLTGYTLEPVYLDIFAKGYASSETLFAPYTQGIKENCHTDISRTHVGSYTQTAAIQLGNTEPGLELDPRLGLIFNPGNYYTGNDKYPYSDYPYTETDPANTFMILRLGEIYLIHAEAEARLAATGGASHYASARASLKAITDRVGYEENYVYTLPDHKLLEMIRLHKWMELVAEYYEEWFDLVRYYKEGDLSITDIKSTITTDRQLILPIPQNALTGNNQLEQNP